MKIKKFFIILQLFILSACSVNINLENIVSFDFHSDIQNEYLLNENIYKLPNNVKGTRELSIPEPLTINWTSIDNTVYDVIISEDEKFTVSNTYKTTKNSFQLYNLKMDTPYYIKIKTKNSESNIINVSVVSSKIRNIYLDGVTNVRDLGGKNTLDNKRIKQGMLFRGAALEGISEFGKNEFKNNLKIKTEIDLRYLNEVGKTSFPSVEGTNYIECPLYFNKLIDSKEIIKKVFESFEDVNNYPIYYHCTIGTDRTGYISFLLNALLGLSIEDIYMDYLFSNFGKIGGSRTKESIDHYVNLILDCKGDTLKEKVENFLFETYQISISTINNIRDILLIKS